MNEFVLDMIKAKRFLNHFPKIQYLGYIPNNYHNRNRVMPQLGFNITLSAQCPNITKYINGKCYTPKVPCVNIGIPDTHIHVKTTDPWEELYFSYPKEELPGFSALRLEDLVPAWEILELTRISNMVNMLQELATEIHQPGTPDCIDAICYSLITMLILQQVAPHKNIPEIEQKVRAAASYIEIHYLDDNPMEVAMKRSGMSRSSFLRHWKQIFKIPPHQHVTNLKMNEAVRLLNDTDLKMYEISERLRYDDPLYFSRMFAKRFKVPASIYRRNPKDRRRGT